MEKILRIEACNEMCPFYREMAEDSEGFCGGGAGVKILTMEESESDDIPSWCPLEDAEKKPGNIPNCTCGAMPEIHSDFCPLSDESGICNGDHAVMADKGLKECPACHEPLGKLNGYGT